MKMPLFTSWEEKRRWLRHEADSWERIITAQEKRGNWAMADEAYIHLHDVEREIYMMEDDMQCSIPRSQREARTPRHFK